MFFNTVSIIAGIVIALVPLREMAGIYEHNTCVSLLANSELLHLSPANIATTPLPTPTDSKDSSNDEDQPPKKRRSIYTIRKVRADGLLPEMDQERLRVSANRKRPR